MAQPFHRRIFIILVTMTAVPTILAVAGWVPSVRTLPPSAGARASLEEVVTSARALAQGVDTMQLTPAARAALRHHLERVSSSASLARRGETYLRSYTAGFAIVIVVLGVVVLFAAVRLAGHLSRQLSRPIDELVGWTQLIRVRHPLPAGTPARGAPEFESLRQSLRDLASALDVARDKELEAERLRAFREVARRVAHEIKNPLTSMRIAVDTLSRTVGQSDSRTDVAMQVMVAETDRLERLAREFADFGRMPEGAQSEVDLQELLEELGRTGVPGGVRASVEANGGRRSVMGHYEPLRRAFANLLRNADEAMNGCGAIVVRVTGGATGCVVTIADHGPGIPEDLRPRIFEPYFTTKQDGTGLGLALVHQTIDAHRGTISVTETPGGGATFTMVFAT